MRSRRRRQEGTAEPATEPFFQKEKKTGGDAFFRQGAGVAESGVIQTKPDDDKKKKDAGVSAADAVKGAIGGAGGGSNAGVVKEDKDAGNKAADTLKKGGAGAAGGGKDAGVEKKDKAPGNTTADTLKKGGIGAAGAAKDPSVAKEDADIAKPDAGILTDTLKDAGTGAAGGALAKDKDAGTSAASTAFDIKSIRNEFISVICAEAWPGQEADIAWIYYNNILDKGATGLTPSSAYNRKSDNYKIAMTALGDTRYGADKLRDKWVKDAKVPETTVQEYVDKNAYFKSSMGPRVARVTGIIDGIIAKPSANPHPGWTGQGNLNDINGLSSPSKYWKMARAYFWLQKERTVKERLVEVVGSGKTVQFIFDGKKIEKFFKTNKLPKDVPLIEVKDAQ